VEAGLRSYNRLMPEEFNRIVADHCVDVRFCPTITAQDNLAREGIVSGVYLPGDVMLDAVMYFNDGQTDVLERLEINPCTYLLMTIHRPTITQDDLLKIFSALKELDEMVIFPCHPRFRAMLPAHSSKIRVIQPVGYLDMLTLEKYAKMALTDSSGVQRESYYFGIPCLTLRTETELVETVIAGRNVVVGADTEKIVQLVRWGNFSIAKPEIFGDGNAAKYIVRHLEYA
jgi:UDP-N-acetylglucosamine 2-epimerase